jgi:LAO/AO transport system kinase
MPLGLDAVARGGKAALARALALLEQAPEGAESLALLEAAWQAPRAQVVGITGPPGVGKSTLTGALLAEARRRGRRVAVVAVDPSSKSSGGALLGDRLRLDSDPEDPDAFVRSMAARDRLGGLARETFAAVVLLRALYDLVLVETVGVGQSETDIAELADTVIFCVQPASGDAVQFMKAGIVEIPEIAVVTKADLGNAARRALADLKGALSLARADADWTVECLALAARAPGAAATLLEVVERHWAHLAAAGRLAERRRRQARAWLTASLRELHGTRGLARVAARLAQPWADSPFTRLAALGRDIEGGQTA